MTGAAPAVESPAVSPAQREIWSLVAQSPEAADAYAEAVVLRVDGVTDTSRLAASVSHVLARHPMLGMRFPDLDQAQPGVAPAVTVRDLRGCSDAERERERTEVSAAATSAPPMAHGPLARAWVLVDEYGHDIVLAAHHLVCDGWSFGVLLDEIARHHAGEPLPPVGPLPRATDAAVRDQALAYWGRVLDPLPPATDLPCDFPRPPVRGFASARLDHRCRPETSARVRARAEAEGCSVFAVLEAGVAAWLSRLTRQEDLVVGIAVADQARRVAEDPVGHAVHVLPRRHHVPADAPFGEILRRTCDTLADALEHADVSFGDVLATLPVARDPARIPLVHVLLNLDPRLPTDRWSRLGCTASVRSLPRRAEAFEWFVNIVDTGTSFVFEVQYATALFDADTMASRIAALEALVSAACAEPGTPVGAVPLGMPDDDETHRAREAAQLAAAPASLPSVMADVGAMAQRTPAHPAVQAPDGTLSYAALLDAAAEAVRRLRDAEVPPGGRVGVALPRTQWLPAWLLGCLWHKAAFVPLDADAPAERLTMACADADVHVVVSDRLERFPSQRVLDASLMPPDLSSPARAAAPVEIAPLAGAHLAYVQFTSGTTGRPKGVQVPEVALAQALWALRQRPGLSAGDAWLALTPLTFDIAIAELLLPLTTGATVRLAAAGVAADGAALRDLLRDAVRETARETAPEIVHDAPGAGARTVVQATPSTWRLALEAGWHDGRGLSVWCGGEALPPALADALRATGAEVWNVYGPTEATIWCTAGRITEGPVTVGPALPGVAWRVQDATGRPLPAGCPGALWVGGRQVADGYAARPDLTAERFRVPSDGAASCRWYDTGDLALWLPDGRLRVLGRTDEQVKLRGHRLELGEVDAAACRLPDVADAASAVVTVGDGDDRLVTWVVLRPGATWDPEALREALRRFLPRAAVPAQVERVAVLPVSANGKRDRRALVAGYVAPGEGSMRSAPPRDEAERRIAGFAAALLRVPRVSRDADFFAMGGHSLLLARWQQQVAAAFGVPLALRDVLASPTVAGVAAQVARLAQTRPDDPLPAAAPDAAPLLSPLQARLWYLQQAAPDSPVYGLPAAWWLRGPADDAALDAAFTALVARHPSLRTVFDEGDGAPQVRVLDPFAVQLERRTPAGEDAESRRAAAVAQAQAEARRPVPLGPAPAWRAALYCTAPEERLLVFTPHHLVFDGWSFDVLLADLQALLTGRPLPPLSRTPQDVSAALHAEATRPERAAALARWKERLEGTDGRLALATDRPRGTDRGGLPGHVPLALTPAQSARVRAAAAAARTTPFVVLAAAFAHVLARHAGQRDISLGTPVRGRFAPAMEGMLGFFVNTVVLRCRSADATSAAALVAAMRDVVQDALGDDRVPFDALAHALLPTRDPAHTPLYGAFFSYQDIRDRPTALGPWSLAQEVLAPGAVAHDVGVWWRDDGVALHGALEYDASLFDAWRMTAMAEQVIEAVVRLADGDAAFAAPWRWRTDDAARLAALDGGALPAGPSCLAVMAAVVAASPDRVAVRAGDTARSYAELWESSGHVARALRHRGLGAGDRVGVVASREVTLPAVVLACLRAGVTCVPLDAALPVARLDQILAQAGERLRLLAGSDLPDGAGGHLAAVPTVQWETLHHEGAALASALPIPDDRTPAYLLFTSGTTGQPKGVEVPHGALSAFLAAIGDACPLQDTDVVGAITTLGFDIAMLELLLPLTVGATVAVADAATAGEGRALAAWLAAQQVTVLQGTPTTWQVLVDDGWRGPLRLALSGGEPLSRALADRLLSRAAQVRNLYGPTETTVWSTWQAVTAGLEAPALGRPLRGTWCAVTDAHGQAVPPGAVGELWIGGTGVALGYAGRPDLTDARFAACPARDGARAYRTGDLVRQDADGALRFVGRADRQVKIRGHRIELVELEAIVSAMEGVGRCVADARAAADGMRELCVWVQGDAATAPTGTAIRRWVRAHLPSAMVPTHVVRVDALPLSSSGKVDVRRLPDPRQAAAATAPPMPLTTPTERTLAAIWAEHLGHPVSHGDLTFFDAGGHSLVSLRVAAAMQRAFGVRPPVLLLVTRTLRELAAWADAERGGGTA